MALTADQKQQLTDKARQIRVSIIQMLAGKGSGHPGGSLGMADMFTALYFGGMARIDGKRPDWPERDRIVLSNGHICPVLYACLAEAGYFPKDWLPTLREVDSHLQGHPAMHKTPGVEASTGSLGHGFSMSVGMAIALQHDKADNRVFALLGDGECQEGLVWEAAMCAAHYKLNNLTAIVDRNDAQIDGTTEDVMSLEPFADKWKAFGWNTLVIDGHDFDQIADAISQAKAWTAGPTVILATTTMSKGVSFMEAEGYKWHGKAPSKEQGERALQELGA